LSIDLASIPPLSQPSPPSNTLLITKLEDPNIFHPASLATIRQHIEEIAPLNSFSPLKSLSRIIVSFYDIEASIRVRQEFDGSVILGSRPARCYFGEPTPIGDTKKYLEKPDAGKLFFISPPPSPPVGWEMKNEDAPNKTTHADDLATKLAALTSKMEHHDRKDEEPSTQSQSMYTREELYKLKTAIPPAVSSDSPSKTTPRTARSRSSTIIYDPKAHGDSPALPAVMLETEDEPEPELDDLEKKIIAHTSRPPVELME
jgi:hypothetical protein